MSWKAPPKEKIQTLKLSDQPYDLDLSNDGKLLAIAVLTSDDALIRVINTKDGSIASEYAADAAMGIGVAFVDGGKSFVYVVRDDKHHHHSLFRVKLGGKPKRIAKWAHTDFRVIGISRNRNGTLYAINGDKTQIRRASDNEIVREIAAASTHPDDSRSYFNQAGDKLWISGIEPSKLIEFDIKSGKALRKLVGPGKAGQYLALSPDDRYLVALGDLGKGVAIYDLAATKPKRIVHDAEELATWDDTWRGGGAFVFTPDSSVAVYLSIAVEAWRLPKWELMDDDRPNAIEGAAYT